MNNNWVLIWASDNNIPMIRSPKPGDWHFPFELQFQANLRILDPIVLNKLNKNITIPLDITTKFEEMTETVTSKQWDTMKYQFGQSILSVEPVKFNDCSSKDCLAVVINDRTCLCGLEPPTSRLTVERASQLRHGGFVVTFTL
ncbi:hypothetical protein BC833DRAFT_569948 [Globomyces pollinis-pini]|nr:hypothetical protein BC833DRAFT_569948 [Globomyces pollinis-pini]